MSLVKDSEDLPVEVDLVELKQELSKNGLVICPVHGCSEDFKSLWGLKYHLKQNNHHTASEGKFKCEQCNLLFQSRVTLRQHRIVEHSGSEGGSPLSSPSSKGKGESFHFTSANSTKQKTRQTKPATTEGEKSSIGGSSSHDLLAHGPDSSTCTDLNERLPGNHDVSAKSGNSRHSGLEEGTSICVRKDGDKTTGSTKRKRGQPRKAPKTPRVTTAKSDNTTASKSSQLTTDGSHPDQLVSMKKGSSSSKTKKDKTPSVTPRRTSTRVRTPRQNLYIYEDTKKSESLPSTSRRRGLKRKVSYGDESEEESEDDASNKRTSKTPNKRGRKPNRTSSKNNGESLQDSSNVNLSKTHEKKRGRKRKNVVQDSAVNNGINDDKEKDGEDGDVKEDEDENGACVSIDGDDDDNDDNDYNGNDEELDSRRKPTKTKRKPIKKEADGNKTTAKKKQGRKKGPVLSERMKLKKRINAGQKLSCKNKGCGAKFTTVLGYNFHKERCGIKEEERQKYACEVCGKEYTTIPGLSYHMKAKHVESEPGDSDHAEDKNEEKNTEMETATEAGALEPGVQAKAVEPEVMQNGRIRRKAASRAMSKVQQLVTDHKLEETKRIKTAKSLRKHMPIRKDELDQLLSTVQGRDVTKEQEDRWSETLKEQLDIECPCKGCSERFTSVSSIKEHLETCEEAVSYKCLACGRLFGALLVARNHVNHWHVGYTPGGEDHSDSSDADFCIISSEESEHDSDVVEIEEIEESGSDMDKDFNEAEEIFVWDDKRKKYKKPKKKASVNVARSSKVGPIGGNDCQVYSTMKKWRQEVHKHKELFPNLRPSLSHWSPVDASEIDQYIPEAAVSPPFTIRRKGEDPGTEPDRQLPLFESTSKDDSCVYGDVTFNVGGPVWALAWCPVPDSSKKAEQFLAISTHRSLDQVHSIHNTTATQGLIQLWNVGQLEADSPSSGWKATLSLGLAHNYGAIWDISWCPSGTWEPVSPNKNKKDDLSRLGIMAVACGDGLVRILSIPWPSELFSVLDIGQSDSHSSHSSVIMHATPHAVLIPCALGVAYDGQCGQAWCVKWLPHSMHEKIATGFSDGTVAIWNLLTESVLLKESLADGRKTFRLSPFLHIKTNSSVIKGLAWCPQNPNIIATGSYDRQYKLWNLKTPHMPLAIVRRGIPTELHWPVSYGNIVSCEDDCFQTARCPTVVRNFSFAPEKCTTMLTAHNSTIWSISVSDWSRLLACGDAGGEVEGVHLRMFLKEYLKFGIYRAYLEKLHPDTSPNENNHEEREDITSKQDKDNSDHESLKESKVDVSIRQKDASHPRTTKEVFEQHKLVFYDVNTIEFTDVVSKSDPDVKRLSNPASMQGIPYESSCSPQAIHKVRFNPNKQAFTWLASGGAAGLARLHLVKQVKDT